MHVAIASRRNRVYPASRRFARGLQRDVGYFGPESLLKGGGTAHLGRLTGGERLVKTSTKVVSHGRSVTFQWAKIAAPRSLFRKIISLLDDLPPSPAPDRPGILTVGENDRRDVTECRSICQTNHPNRGNEKYWRPKTLKFDATPA